VLVRTDSITSKPNFPHLLPPMKQHTILSGRNMLVENGQIFESVVSASDKATSKFLRKLDKVAMDRSF